MLYILSNDFSYYYQLMFQDEATILMLGLSDLHDYILFYLMMILSIVTYFVLLISFNYNLNIMTKELNHHSTLEIMWTILPGIILLLISMPSFKLLYYSDEVFNPYMTLKVEANQWYWSYSMNDYIGLNIEFSSYAKTDLENYEMKLLSVDNIIYLPINMPISVLVTSTDVMHSWGMPSLGMKMDAMAGSMNHGLMLLLSKGMFYGQCYELCGLMHKQMPIVMMGTDNLNYLSWMMSFFDMNMYNLINILKTI